MVHGRVFVVRSFGYHRLVYRIALYSSAAPRRGVARKPGRAIFVWIPFSGLAFSGPGSAESRSPHGAINIDAGDRQNR